MAKKAKKKKRVYKKKFEINHPMSMIVHTKKLKKNLEDEKEETNKDYIEIMNERLTRDYDNNPTKPRQ